MSNIIQKVDDMNDEFPKIELWKNNLDSYSNKHGLEFKKQVFYLAKRDEAFSGLDLDGAHTGVVLVRMALSDLEGRMNSAKKYVILQTYHNNGDLGTIDVVRLPKDLHREIVKEYLDNILTPEISEQIVPINNDGLSRFLTAGGLIDSNGENITFKGKSGDFSNKFSVYDVNVVASYLAQESGLFRNVAPKDVSKGQEYIERCLDIMAKSKLNSEFYVNLVDLYFLENIKIDVGTGPHILYSLHLIKSIDRALAENENMDIFQIMTEELTEGISRDMLVRGVAEKVKKARNK
jgi:hypothetical protein